MKKKWSQEQKDALYWRYKKQEPPIDEFSNFNGEVKIVVPKSPNIRLESTPKGNSLPHPFKCSKCDYIAKDKPDFNDHWSLEH